MKDMFLAEELGIDPYQPTCPTNADELDPRVAVKVTTFKESGKYYDEFEIKVMPEGGGWFYIIEAVREYKKIAEFQSNLDWLIGMDNIIEGSYPIIIRGE